ncbi:MAG: DUF4255 domain-containing protein [Spirochaetales bacterium]|nr:DUF4255 domain-containing protein [Spirochaetales bacterium]
MNNFFAIGIIGEIFRGLLSLNLQKIYNSDFNSESIKLASPKDVESGGSVRLTLFLYQIVENAYTKNQPMRNTGAGSVRQPPLSLNLYYLITPYAGEPPYDSEVEKNILLGKVMQIIYDNAILKGTILSDAMKEVSLEYDNINYICFSLNPISLDDLTKLWNALDMPMQLSVAYEVRIAFIESERKEKRPRIISKSEDFYQKGGSHGS